MKLVKWIYLTISNSVCPPWAYTWIITVFSVLTFSKIIVLLYFMNTFDICPVPVSVENGYSKSTLFRSGRKRRITFLSINHNYDYIYLYDAYNHKIYTKCNNFDFDYDAKYPMIKKLYPLRKFWREFEFPSAMMANLRPKAGFGRPDS